MTPGVSARLDKKTQSKVLCGYARCPGQLGIVLDGFPSGEEEAVLLMPYLRADVGPRGEVIWRSFRRAIKNFAHQRPAGRRRREAGVMHLVPPTTPTSRKTVWLYPDPPYPYREYRPVDLPAVVICPECRTRNQVAWELLLPLERA